MNAISRLGIALSIYAGLPFAAQAADSAPVVAPEGRSGWFAGGGLGSLYLDQSGLPLVDHSYVFVQGGWRFNQFLAVGARAGAGSSASLDLSDVDFDLDGDPAYSGIAFRITAVYELFARAFLPLSENWDLYAQVGVAHSRLEASVLEADSQGVLQDVSVADSATSFAYGVGLSWNLNERFAVDLEVQPVVAEANEWSTSSASLAFRLRF